MYPKRFYRQQPRQGLVRWIVIHSTNCRYPFPKLKFIDDKFQTNQILFGASLDGEDDSIFHVVIDKVKDDYYPIFLKPLHYTYTGFNIKNTQINNGLHICIIGDLNQVKPDTRLYDVLAYRVLSPLMYIFRIPRRNVLLHRHDCPGKLFDLQYLMSLLKKYQVF